MNGIDVSQWQGYVQFETVRDAGIELVYVKASEGVEYVDPFFYRNYANATRAGIAVGFYHNLTAATKEEARAEAYHFMATVAGLCCSARLVMNMEVETEEECDRATSIVYTFLESVEAYSGRRAVVCQDDFFLDVARENWPEKKCVGWRYTDIGRVAGIQGNVGRSIFRDEILEENDNPILLLSRRPDYPVVKVPYRIYRVQYGDTLYHIAKKHGTTVDELVHLNKIKSPSLLYAGQLIKVFTC